MTMLDFSEIRKIDGAVADAIVAELERQQHNIELIASENIVSKAVMYTMGTPLTNKYAEGYPAKRYYGGCEKVDIVENLAKENHMPKSANVILLGAAAPFLKILDAEVLRESVGRIFASKGEEVVQMNYHAFDIGHEYVKQLKF